MRKLLSVIILILFSNFVYSYPVIITEQGVNHTEVKQLVYSIPEKYYKFIDVIEFRPYYAYPFIVLWEKPKHTQNRQLV